MLRFKRRMRASSMESKLFSSPLSDCATSGIITTEEEGGSLSYQEALDKPHRERQPTIMGLRSISYSSLTGNLPSSVSSSSSTLTTISSIEIGGGESNGPTQVPSSPPGSIQIIDKSKIQAEDSLSESHPTLEQRNIRESTNEDGGSFHSAPQDSPTASLTSDKKPTTVMLSPTNTTTAMGDGQVAPAPKISKMADICLDESSPCTKRAKLCSVSQRKSETVRTNDVKVNMTSLNVLNDEAPYLPNTYVATLLSAPSDRTYLSALHCFVRRQIEVFVATAEDTSAPSPGRKSPIHIGQVGLRCVHCHSAGNGADKDKKRLKRAIAYPSCVNRVYNAVSDMKHDHLSVCPHLPIGVREEFERLTSHFKRRKSGTGEKPPRKYSASAPACSSASSYITTAQYYYNSAIAMGMVDLPDGGMRLGEPEKGALTIRKHIALSSGFGERQMQSHSSSMPANEMADGGDGRQLSSVVSSLALSRRSSSSSLKSASCLNPPPPSNMKSHHKKNNSGSSLVQQTPASPATYSAREHVCLSDFNDDQVLNPIHCFVRRNVEVFVASNEDLASPSPGRRTAVVLGQVGIRCVHCAHLPSHDRAKRAVCYPPVVGGIYHAVSNMKFDHFRLCQALPPAVRKEYDALRNTSSGSGRRREGGRKTRARSTDSSGSTPSTSQYYCDSALRLGLVNTKYGIRFITDPNSNAIHKVQHDQQSRDGAAAQSVPRWVPYHNPTSLSGGLSSAPLAHRLQHESRMPPLSSSSPSSTIIARSATDIASSPSDGMSALVFAAAAREAEQRNEQYALV